MKSYRRLKNVTIENDNYIKVIEKYDRKHTLFFLDTSYECKGNKYNGETTFDYDELLNACKKITGKFILILNSELEDKFNEFNIISNDVNYSIECTSESSKPYKEIIVTNYDILDVSRLDAVE